MSDQLPKKRKRTPGPKLKYTGNYDSHDGMAGNMASNSWNHQSRVYTELNKKQPVKVFTKEEIEAYKRKKGL